MSNKRFPKIPLKTEVATITISKEAMRLSKMTDVEAIAEVLKLQSKLSEVQKKHGDLLAYLDELETQLREKRKSTAGLGIMQVMINDIRGRLK